ncbi:MAG TPA: tRNA pseudouridine(38-40) synthase TruA [Edaphobacter sp.]|jgi:tRNA pseudouridine38-40 synthase|nr:tRNA pseudouridine(38-40) synthase TruA [Edaphobacter sp.]
MHWKLTLTYDGTPYNGWQIQPNLPTVQGTLARVLHRITGESVLPQGSGRTDTGVHALGQVASFSLDTPIPALNLHRALNNALPPSIRILSVEEVPETFHARHSATRKTYEYRILPRGILCSPFRAPFVWPARYHLNFESLQQAAALVVGTYDFTSFAATDPDATTRSQAEPSILPISSPTRTIHQSTWRHEGDLLIYRVTGSGFLHHMVRNLVGTFVECASNRRSPDSIPEILAARNRSAAGFTAPARGLFLVEVEYKESSPQQRCIPFLQDYRSGDT